MRSVWAVAVAIVFATGLGARAEEVPVGYVKTVAGTATVIHGAAANALRSACRCINKTGSRPAAMASSASHSVTTRGSRSARTAGSS